MDGRRPATVLAVRPLTLRIERLLFERAVWSEDGVVELLGPGHATLIVRASGATRMVESRAA